jgi:VIT1/CCC1 family predicted Fe2+/Mn2+ transporter
LTTTRDDLSRYRENLQGEVDGAALYRTLAELERKPELAEVYRRLAAVEQAHADFWAKRLAAGGDAVGDARPSWRARLLIFAARRLGASSVLPVVKTMETIGREQYDTQPEASRTDMPAEERSHARILQKLAETPRTRWDGAVYSRLEGRHGSGGGNVLRAAVLGVNDGLVSNAALVMGAAGAAFEAQTLVITGLAGLLGGACSMAMGEWLSVQSARELYRKQIATEADELARVPEEEREELVLIYQAKGLLQDEARAMADRVMSDKTTALDTLVREELGINPEDLGGSAWAAAASSFLVFVLGAIVPVAPFAFLGGPTAVWVSAGVTGAALFLVGAAISVLTGRGVLFSGTRQLLIGLAAAAVTFGVGRLLGVAVSG